MRAARRGDSAPAIGDNAAMALPTKPSRTDAYVRCGCGGTMQVTAVAPIVNRPDHMRHSYVCVDCGAEANFEVAKRGVPTGEGKGEGS
jgi:hypothetical protein